jgi:hypothetical protein
MWMLWVVPLMILFPFVVGFVTAMLEKRRVWPYLPAQAAEAVGGPFIIGTNAPVKAVFEDDGPVPATAHIAATNQAAYQRGFIPVAVMRDNKGKIYRIRYDFWLSPDYAILVLVGGGSLASIPLANTWFYTKLADGRRLVTINSPNASEADLTGLNQEALVNNASFDKQLHKHIERMGASGQAAIPYSPQDPLADHYNLLRDRVDRMAQSGYVTYLDADHVGWKYTPKGALVLAIRMVLKGYKRSFVADKTNRA